MQSKVPAQANQAADVFFGQFNDTAGSPTGAETPRLYTNWCNDYESSVLSMSNGYWHPSKLAKLAEAHLKDKSSRILDVCSGTGLGGLALRQLGFTNIDGIDASSGMLSIAAKKQVYKNLFEELIGYDKIHCLQQGCYDAIVTSGSFLPGHLGAMHLRPLMGVLKPGGIFCMALRDEYLLTDYLADLEQTMERMEQQGCWSKVQIGVMDHYYNDLPGKFYIYRKM